jgi:hypothetical protein
MTEMQQKLVDGPRRRQNDSEMYKTIDNISDQWFHCALADLSMDRKARLLPYIYRSYRTGIAQLSRCFGLGKAEVARMLRMGGP